VKDTDKDVCAAKMKMRVGQVQAYQVIRIPVGGASEDQIIRKNLSIAETEWST
jgi:hypothetical protein